MKRTIFLYNLLIFTILWIGFFSWVNGEENTTSDNLVVSIIIEEKSSLPIKHGIEKLTSALQEKEISFEHIDSLKEVQGNGLIAAGLTDGPGIAATLLSDLDISIPQEPESIVIHRTTWQGKPAVVLAGTDDRGLMYALLDTAERIRWAISPQKPFSEIENIVEKPYVIERAISKYTMHQRFFESCFFDETYWAKYFDILTKNRFNSFVLIFGYENWGYFAPPYPYFTDVDEYPDVHVVGLSKEKQKKNLIMLNRIIEMAHERGIDFTVGIWNHIYRGGVEGPIELTEKPTEGIVWGLNANNLIGYSKAALKTFLQKVPEINAIQFRMHGESGLKRSEFKGFWEDIYQIMNQHGSDLRFDARAKNFPHDLIDSAIEQGVPMRITTKYWMEQMGLPFHPTHINRGNQFDRRHGYADMLRYPKTYDIHWRLWNGGTSRILLWGDPEYVRRFSKSTYLYNAKTFEVNEPLATKMQDHPHDLKPFELLNEKYQYYDYEFERYWHFFQVFGRLGYNPNTSPDIWRHEFQHRFGNNAAPYIEEGLHQASKILPMIIAYIKNRFPTTRGWVEKQRVDDLSDYAKLEPSDTQLFLSIEKAAEYQLQGKRWAKRHPYETSQWFAKVSNHVLDNVQKAKENMGETKSNEWTATITDLKILSYLALYHSKRIHAGVNYALFEHSHDLNALDDAIEWEEQAIQAWKKLVESAGDVYTDNLMMGRARIGLSGHWKDELDALNKGLDRLRDQREQFQPRVKKMIGQYEFKENVDDNEFRQYLERDEDITLQMPSGYYELDFVVDNSDHKKPCGPMWIEANSIYRTDTFTIPPGEMARKTLETHVANENMNIVFKAFSYGRWDVDSIKIKRIGPMIAHVPVHRIDQNDSLVIKATIIGVDPIEDVRIGYSTAKSGYRYVPMKNMDHSTYHAEISLSEKANHIDYFIEAIDRAGRTEIFPYRGRFNPIYVNMTNDQEAPVLEHQPVMTAKPGQPLKIQAKVQDPSGIKWVRLRYRAVNQHGDYKKLMMLPVGKNGLYEAVIPGREIKTEWNIMYLFEVMDHEGNGKIYPDFEKETPYIIVELDR